MQSVSDRTEASASFTVTSSLRNLDRMDIYSAAQAFVEGRLEVSGDLLAAIRWKRQTARNSLRARTVGALVRRMPRLESWFQSKTRAARNIRFHYDRSNEFYSQFLGNTLVYSCAYFRHPDDFLDEAQEAKLEHICRKLAVQPGERFLDIGCGWGSLVFWAARKHGARASGCTLSVQQSEYARNAAQQRDLGERVTIYERDYRELGGVFDKIASVGMFEHVGVRRLPLYFRKVHSLLADGGLFLNHGIARPSAVKRDGESLFLLRRVFPGGELASLGEVVRAAERAGFEVLDVENLRPHYALTCQAWVHNLQEHESECLRTVDPATYRTWLLYLAGSAVAFQEGLTDVYQVLMAKRGAPRRRMTREYMYPVS